MKRRTILNILIVLIVVVLLWPAPDPLQGVETVALSTQSSEANLSSQILEGLEIALGNHRIRIVSDANQADAVLTIEPQSAQIDLNFDQEGFRGSGTVRCLVKKNGQESVMFLHITVDDNGVQAQLVGRKFWEVWK